MDTKQVHALLERGVVIPRPETVEIAAEVRPERIAPGVIVHTGCQVLGASTSIGPGCVLGAEAPVTVENCQLGHNVALKGGCFSGATFLDGANMGSGAHIRPGTLLEEEANGAHAVGLKQTILLPFVTLGSLINFCDVLMAGGTDRKNHSEVGSSYIHFNYTPHQDKATASLLGDVPRGVMLDQPAIFLGGQGGLVGPCHIGFGCVVPAGLIWREDAPGDGLLLQPTPRPTGTSKPFTAGAFRSVERIVRNNLQYLGNLRALHQWYQYVRQPVMSEDTWDAACYAGAQEQLRMALEERIKRLKELAGRMPRSIELARQNESADAPWLAEQEKLRHAWPTMEAVLKQAVPENLGAVERDVLLMDVGAINAGSYLETVRALSPAAKKAGTAWLQKIVQATMNLW
ncbi:MAG: UDP-N-acetylglucosamine pyrophosphorylase [Verrucomicrobia bacterium]|nr:MAG: UDP-N-acetylglucosamine pyrophosphorylase [Verrucomicrobiota bacterium]